MPGSQRLRFLNRRLALWVLFGMLLAATAAATFVVTNHQLFPYSRLVRAEQLALSAIEAMLPERDGGASAPTPVSTALLDLAYVTVEVPVSRPGRSGGLTSVDDELVLLTHEGTIWLADPEGVTRTAISAPPNGFDDYVAFAETSDLEHHFHKFRYNDILYYVEDQERGLIASFTQWFPDTQCYATTVAGLVLPETFESILEVSAESSDWRTIHRTRPCLPPKERYRAIEGHMAGGRLAYAGESHVLLASGDYGWDGWHTDDVLAQDDANDYGKILDVDIRTGTARIVSKGHRNPQGIIVATDGTIWSTEHGPMGGDELNRIVTGGNYGWPLETYGTSYHKTPYPTARDYGRHTRFLAPVYSWIPSVGLSHLAEVTNFHPAWDGDLIAGSLVGTTLYRIRIRDERAVFAEPIRIGEGIRYVHMTGRGQMVVWTDSQKLLFISVVERTPSLVIDDFLTIESDLTDGERDAVVAAIDQCVECHAFDSIDHEKAPGLGAVFGHRIGTTAYRNYSDAMANHGGEWSSSNLAEFLDDPHSVVAGTSMPDPMIDDPRVRQEIVDILKALALREQFE